MTMMIQNSHKPKIGITIGDINGIGAELIIKALSDNRILEFCTPIIFASAKVINFYRKTIPEIQFSFTQLKDPTAPNPKQANVLNCWEEEILVTPGVLNETGGMYAAKALDWAVEALKAGDIDGLVTAPIHKKNIQSTTFNFTGHTPYLQHAFASKNVLMFMVADNLKVGLVTEHVAVKDVAQHLSKQIILDKIKLMNDSLKKDFGIDKPKIAVLALNPHAGDEGLIGKEEEEIIKPAIKEAKLQNILVIGAFSADAFFARNMYEQFDGVLAMYHDQGLIPFKSLAFGEGINFSAGLPIVRTSPDHGTAFDIAGKNKAEHQSLVAAIFQCVDIINNRRTYDELRSNPLKKVTKSLLANAVDERIVLD
jgi:4-phospho-D-threonate 3-dehydrogenase / 4-phospho-D-erythronate 3-dehydrogenase